MTSQNARIAIAKGGFVKITQTSLGMAQASEGMRVGAVLGCHVKFATRATGEALQG